MPGNNFTTIDESCSDKLDTQTNKTHQPSPTRRPPLHRNPQHYKPTSRESSGESNHQQNHTEAFTSNTSLPSLSESSVESVTDKKITAAVESSNPISTLQSLKIVSDSPKTPTVNNGVCHNRARTFSIVSACSGDTESTLLCRSTYGYDLAASVNSTFDVTIPSNYSHEKSFYRQTRAKLSVSSLPDANFNSRADLSTAELISSIQLGRQNTDRTPSGSSLLSPTTLNRHLNQESLQTAYTEERNKLSKNKDQDCINFNIIIALFRCPILDTYIIEIYDASGSNIKTTLPANLLNNLSEGTKGSLSDFMHSGYDKTQYNDTVIDLVKATIPNWKSILQQTLKSITTKLNELQRSIEQTEKFLAFLEDDYEQNTNYDNTTLDYKLYSNYRIFKNIITSYNYITDNEEYDLWLKQFTNTVIEHLVSTNFNPNDCINKIIWSKILLPIENGITIHTGALHQPQKVNITIEPREASVYNNPINNLLTDSLTLAGLDTPDSGSPTGRRFSCVNNHNIEPEHLTHFFSLTFQSNNLKAGPFKAINTAISGFHNIKGLYFQQRGLVDQNKSINLAIKDNQDELENLVKKMSNNHITQEDFLRIFYETISAIKLLEQKQSSTLEETDDVNEAIAASIIDDKRLFDIALDQEDNKPRTGSVIQDLHNLFLELSKIKPIQIEHNLNIKPAILQSANEVGLKIKIELLDRDTILATNLTDEGLYAIQNLIKTVIDNCLDIHCNNLDLTLRLEKNNLVITVQDNGTGKCRQNVLLPKKNNNVRYNLKDNIYSSSSENKLNINWGVGLSTAANIVRHVKDKNGISAGKSIFISSNPPAPGESVDNDPDLIVLAEKHRKFNTGTIMQFEIPIIIPIKPKKVLTKRLNNLEIDIDKNDEIELDKTKQNICKPDPNVNIYMVLDDIYVNIRMLAKKLDFDISSVNDQQPFGILNKKNSNDILIFARDSYQGLKALDEYKKLPDIIFVDVNMANYRDNKSYQNTDGIDFAKKYREQEIIYKETNELVFNPAKIYFITASPVKLSSEQDTIITPSGNIEKFITPDDLNQLVSNHITEKKEYLTKQIKPSINLLARPIIQRDLSGKLAVRIPSSNSEASVPTSYITPGDQLRGLNKSPIKAREDSHISNNQRLQQITKYPIIRAPTYSVAISKHQSLSTNLPSVRTNVSQVFPSLRPVTPRPSSCTGDILGRASDSLGGCIDNPKPFNPRVYWP